jgi:aldehyde dehydrogenase (NAD+)
VFADVTDDITIVRQEIFGLVLVAIPFDDDAEPIAMTNDSNFGLGSRLDNHTSIGTLDGAV